MENTSKGQSITRLMERVRGQAFPGQALEYYKEVW